MFFKSFVHKILIPGIYFNYLYENKRFMFHNIRCLLTIASVLINEISIFNIA